MINPKFEIDRLKQTLIWKGLDPRHAETVSNLAASDIAEAISELTLNAIAEATQIGENLGIDDFASQIRAISTGNTVMIVTDSGKTDFSTPSVHMLPHLLKNAKVAKDGSLYKVIPIRGKKNSPKGMSSADAAIDMQQAQSIARASLKNKTVVTSGDPLQSSHLFSGLAQAKDFIASKKKVKQEASATPTGPQEFRTATSKQDSNTSWVLPPKERDMTIVLTDINRQLERDIVTTVTSIVRQYEELA